IDSLAWSPDGNLLASGGHDASVRIWNAITGQGEQLLEEVGGRVTGLLFAGDGRLLMAQSSEVNDAIQCWEVKTWKAIATVPVYPTRVGISRDLVHARSLARAVIHDLSRAYEFSRRSGTDTARDLARLLTLDFFHDLIRSLARDRANDLASTLDRASSL